MVAWQFSIALCILTTNILTSSGGRLVSNSAVSWDPNEDMDYLNPSDMDAYRNNIDSSLAPASVPASAPASAPTSAPTLAPSPVSVSMVAGPPEHHKGGRLRFALWCVARPTVPEPMLQKAMDYACGFGADCRNIQNSSASCFQPNSLFAHASYAFNSFWQRTKVNGGTCDFGATAMLITQDPSFGGCQFPYN